MYHHTPGTPPCKEGFPDCPYRSWRSGKRWCIYPYRPMELNYMEEVDPKGYQEFLESITPIEMVETCPIESVIMEFIEESEEGEE